MRWVRSASRWLRANSERYLQEAAERNTAARYGRRPPALRRRPVDLFWRHIFVPVYRALPWRMRLMMIRSMPGSHRKHWRGG
jgi:hypothetical protein